MHTPQPSWHTHKDFKGKMYKNFKGHPFIKQSASEHWKRGKASKLSLYQYQIVWRQKNNTVKKP